MSDSEEEFVSIIATRERRANAGSRLRHLLDLEELEGDTNDNPIGENEDDENVRLLFQEDEEDGEFQDSEDELSDNGSDEEDVHTTNAGSTTQKTSETNDSEGDTEETPVDSDVMLSDSDISNSDSDESEGERELKQQEKTERRKRRKQQLSVQKKKIPSRPKTTTKSVSRPLPETLVERRQSVRKATLESSIALNERLKAEEEERKQIVKPVVRREYVEKTLQERLEEAKITEEENTLSLSLFFEQETQRKKRQRELANARKFKLKEFIRLHSSGVYITPLDEVEIEEEKERLAEIEEEKRLRRKQQYQKRKQAKLIKEAMKKGLPIPKFDEMDAKVLNEGATNEHTTNTIKDIVKEETKNASEDHIRKDIKNDNTNETALKNDNNINVKETTTAIASQSNDSNNDVKIDNVEKDINNVQNVTNDEADQNIKNATSTKQVKEGETEEKEEKDMSNPKSDPKVEPSKEIKGEHMNESTAHTKSETGSEKHVSFAQEDQTQNENDAQIEDNNEYRTFEGPEQYVAVQYVSFEEFRKQPDLDFIKKSLFGPQSLLLSRRDPNYETLEVIRADMSSTVDLKKIQDARTMQFEALMKLPKFGEKYTEVSTFDRNENDNDSSVKITTPAPAGISLANGQRKKCLVSGTFATYYDPNNGLPYSSVECFKVLKNLTDNKFNWCQIDNGGINSRYKNGIGCYLNETGQRHAKGVPDGF